MPSDKNFAVHLEGFSPDAVLFPCAEESLGAEAVGRWLVMLVVLGSVSRGTAEPRIRYRK